MTPQEQDFLDRCAIEVMKAIVVTLMETGKFEVGRLAGASHDIASAMLTERRKRIDGLKVQAEHDNPNSAN